ncbi:Transposon Ty3-I Gag-Pol polyprotein [Anthophora quadrimaculata]
MRLIASRLRGHARQWYDTRMEFAATWAETKVFLVAQFRRTMPFSRLLREADLYEAKPGQQLGDYCFQKLNLIRRLNIGLPDEKTIDMVIFGVPDEPLARTIRSAKHTDPNDLYAYMCTMGNMPGREKKKEPEVRTTIARTVEKSRGRGVPCFNCGKNGHISRECRKPKVECSLCKRLGHRPEYCRQKEVNIIQNPIRNSMLNIYQIYIRVNGHKVESLIDTGSACTIVHSSVAKKFFINTKKVDGTIFRGFAGQSVVISQIASITVKVQNVAAKVDSFIIPDEYTAYDVILGRDFLQQDHVVMLKRGNRLTFNDARDAKRPQATSAMDICVVEENPFPKVGNIGEKARRLCVALLEEFRDCISTSMRDLGKTNTIAMEIKCLTDEPIVYRPYRLAESEKRVVREIIADLLANGIIRESESPYASPITLVKKKTGDVRMCVDYRKLNAITTKNKSPLPLIEDQINQLGGYRYYTGLDLASGYYQVPLAENSIEKTAFVTPDGHYEFLRMPFGLTNAPVVFTKLMDIVLGPLKNRIAFPYIDDVIVPSNIIEEGIGRLRQVLEAFRAHGLTLKLEKCSFFQETIEYLGQEISEQGVRPGQRKTEAVREMPHPENVKQVRQFLGLASYFRKFVKNFATLVEPLTRLTRKNVPWQWKEAQERAFQQIKQKLTMRPVLCIFNPNRPTELHTDASSIGVGAILLQQQEDGSMAVVAYFSKQTTTDQRCYHSYELETMAVVFALRHFRVYLIGTQFKVVTDCNALRTTFSKKDLLPRIGRWWLEVQEYTFKIVYRPGTRMAHVDALSRNPQPTPLKVFYVDVTESEWIVAAQMQDEQLSRIRTVLANNDKSPEVKHYFKEYVLKKGKVYRRMPDNKIAWVVPKDARLQICRLCHDDAGHLSAEKTLERIQRNYWFAGMRQFINKYVKACLSCAYYKHTSGKKQCKLNTIEKVAVPFHTLHIDHVGPFETSRKGNKYLLVMVDAFTKFTIVEPVKDQKTRHTEKVLLNLMYLFGVPTRIISDRGTSFTSKRFATLCTTYGIKHVLNAVATPRANGQVERYNKTIIDALATSAAGRDPRDWDTQVKKVQSAINTMHNKSIDTTPMKALIGCDTKTMAEGTILNAIRNEMDRLDLQTLRENISSHISKEQRIQKERYDRTRREARRYTVDELVLVQVTSDPATGGNRKLLPKYKGPFRIRTVLSNDRYEVEDLREGVKRLRTVVAADRIKPWITIQGNDHGT